MKNKSPLSILFVNVMAIIFAYYVSLLLHEWGHGAVAWLYGVKSSPFDVQYGGSFLMNADENVPYDALIASGRGVAAAMIGIAGAIVSLGFVLLSFISLNARSVKRSAVLFTFSYWFLIINMIPLVQYFAISTFSSEGDVGRFIHGFNISAWWIFVPGIVFITFSLRRIFRTEVPKSYVLIPIKSLLGQNIFLLATLSFLFLFIYSHGYNPLSDSGMKTSSRVLAIISIVLVPLLYIICNPSRAWVKHWVERKDNIYLAPYNRQWPEWARAELVKIKAFFPAGSFLDMQHVGSTAISGLSAKPIIDIQLAVSSLDAIKPIAIPVLNKLGYEYWAENPDQSRMFFVKGMPPYGKKRTHHVHIVLADSHHWRDKLTFRDYLRENPQAAKEYETLKKIWANEHQFGREKYTDAKEDFIKMILKRAAS